MFDLAGTALGITQNKELILGNVIKIGDIILGFEKAVFASSNGYTLARKILSKYSSTKFLNL